MTARRLSSGPPLRVNSTRYTGAGLEDPLTVTAKWCGAPISDDFRRGGSNKMVGGGVCSPPGDAPSDESSHAAKRQATTSKSDRTRLNADLLAALHALSGVLPAERLRSFLL